MNDCRSEDEITLGLVDALIAVSRVLAPRLIGDLPEEVREALRDLRGDGDIKAVVPGPQEALLAPEIFTALGEASMCWERPGEAGVFDCERAKQIGDRLCERLRGSSEIELAWVLIANAYGGDWDEATDEWREAAVRWRDSFIGSGANADGGDPCQPPAK